MTIAWYPKPYVATYIGFFHVAVRLHEVGEEIPTMVNRTNDQLGVTTTPAWDRTGGAESVATLMHTPGHVASDEERGIAIIEGATLSELISIEFEALDECCRWMRLYSVAGIPTDVLENPRRELAERIRHDE